MTTENLTYYLFGTRRGKTVTLRRDSFQAACASMVRLVELGFSVAYEIHEVESVVSETPTTARESVDKVRYG